MAALRVDLGMIFSTSVLYYKEKMRRKGECKEKIENDTKKTTN